MLVNKTADLDGESRFLTHLADERRTMIFTRIRPPARQVPFVPLVQQQQDAALMDQHALDRKRIAHGLAHRI